MTQLWTLHSHWQIFLYCCQIVLSVINFPSFFFIRCNFFVFFSVYELNNCLFFFLSASFPKSVANFYALLYLCPCQYQPKPITDSSNVSSESKSGTLLRRPYCAKALWSDSNFAQRFKSCSHFFLSFSLSFLRFLIKISFIDLKCYISGTLYYLVYCSLYPSNPYQLTSCLNVNYDVEYCHFLKLFLLT